MASHVSFWTKVSPATRAQCLSTAQTMLALVMRLVPLGLLVIGIGFLVCLLRIARYRQMVYRRWTCGHPSVNCHTEADRERVGVVPASIRGGMLAEVSHDATVISALWELNVRSRAIGRYLDPSISIGKGDFLESYFCDRGARGTRLFDISHVFSRARQSGETIALAGKHMQLASESCRLFICSEMPMAADRVLVVAPHPDDAEIAAFGLYSQFNSAIMTITAGEASDLGLPPRSFLPINPETVGWLRAWDSLVVPEIGGVSRERAVNLCYPDGCLGRLRQSCREPHQQALTELPNFQHLRALNQSPLCRSHPACTWPSLVEDLIHAIECFAPTIIATPHPLLDRHDDHVSATGAVCEALKQLKHTNGRFYFYTIHAWHSELWPYGPAGSASCLPPLPHGARWAEFYSHRLPPETIVRKYLALEAMHDLRKMSSAEPTSLRSRLQRIAAEVRAAIHGLGSPPTSLLRRFVRPTEFFHVCSFSQGIDLSDEVGASGYIAH